MGFPDGKRKVNTTTMKSLMEDDSWMPRSLENEDARFTLHSAIWFEIGRNKMAIAIYKLAYFTVQEKGGLYLETTAYLGKGAF